MIRQIITNKGLELLASSSSFEGQNYWLGYYTVAYVPNFWKEPTADIDIVANTQGEIIGGNSIGADPLEGPLAITVTDRDVLNTNMTRLTKFGDIIWNVFQGDLTGNGFADGLSDKSAAGDLFGLTMYSANIKKHYRYVIDEHGNNNLLGWKIDPSNPKLMVEANRYYGTDGFVGSAMPIPAPLYYFGDVSKDNNPGPFDTSLYLNDFLNNTGSDFYPSITVEVSPGSVQYDIPKISSDYRGYLAYDNLPTSLNLANAYFNEYTPVNLNPLASDVFGDSKAWYDAKSTENTTTSLVNEYLNKFYMLLSVSNYNRYHSPVSQDGTILNSDLKNRNMAKVSKLFPIFDYSVINSQRGLSSNGEQREVATGLTLSIDLNLKPLAKTSGYIDGNYNENSDLTLQDRYNNPNNTDTLFNKTTTSFKFNRIGIFAIPLRKAPNIKDPFTKGTDLRFEVEIDPDAEPVLFAVVDWDNAVTLSDSGDGPYQFKAQINVNLESPDGVNETPLVRDTAVFFNLYNDSSINWYKNQLLANASTQHAVMELQQQVNSIRERNTREFTPVQQIVQSSQTSTTGLINLLDSNNKASGGLKGINTYAESTILPETFALYELGLNSITLGNGTATEHDNSFVTGLNNHAFGIGSSSSIIGGNNNLIDRDGSSSSIIGGNNNLIKDTVINGTIIGSDTSKIFSAVTNSIILGGNNNIIWDPANNSGILSAELSEIFGSLNSVIVGGLKNKINSNRSVILGGEELYTSFNNQVVLGKFNDSNPDAHLIIGDGSIGSPSNAFEFITKTLPAIAGQRTINIKSIATNTDVPFLNSGDIYIDGSTYDGNGYVLRIKA